MFLVYSLTPLKSWRYVIMVEFEQNRKDEKEKKVWGPGEFRKGHVKLESAKNKNHVKMTKIKEPKRNYLFFQVKNKAPLSMPKENGGILSRAIFFFFFFFFFFSFFWIFTFLLLSSYLHVSTTHNSFFYLKWKTKHKLISLATTL